MHNNQLSATINNGNHITEPEAVTAVISSMDEDTKQPTIGKWITTPLKRLTIEAFRLAQRFIAPSRCLACHEWLIDDALWCHNCWPDVPFITASTCPTCRRPEPHATAQIYSCASCQDQQQLHHKLLSLYYYKRPVANLIKQLKYQRQIYIAKLVAQQWQQRFSNELHNYDLLVPIPLHWRRLVWRGYNQSYELAKALHKYSGIPVVEALAKTRATAPQTRATRKERLGNLATALALKAKFSSRVEGRKILIVDDVLTTGATATTASNILLKAGAKEIAIITIAVTPLPHWSKGLPQEEKQ